MLKPRPDDDQPATKRQIRELKKELADLRTDLFQELHEVTDGLGERYDEIEDIVQRNRRAITRVKRMVEEE